MKYRIKSWAKNSTEKNYHNVTGDIIELEPIDEPKCECVQCDEQMFLDQSLSDSIHGEPLEEEETLFSDEEKNILDNTKWKEENGNLKQPSLDTQIRNLETLMHEMLSALHDMKENNV